MKGGGGSDLFVFDEQKCGDGTTKVPSNDNQTKKKRNQQRNQIPKSGFS